MPTPSSRPVSILIVICAALVLAVGGANSLSAQVKIVAHPSVPISEMDRRMLLAIFTGDEQSWDDESPIVVIDLGNRSESDTRESFYRYLGTSPSRIKSMWIKKKLSGEGDPPRSFDTEEEVLAEIAGTPGAVGYVGISVDTEGSGVKTLLVAGST
jgi:ABC-type phosphate transport system substrate-binding protein